MMTKRKVVSGKILPNPESDRILGQSLVFREFKKEKQEINKLKWIESEKSGKDIGFEKALFLWARAHRQTWRAARLRKRSRSSKLNPFSRRR